MSNNLEFEVYFEMINNELDAAIEKAAETYVKTPPINANKDCHEAELCWTKALFAVLGQRLGMIEADLVAREETLDRTIEEERNNNIRDGYAEFWSECS